MIASPFLLLFLVAADDKPTPKLPLGKETTYITEPLDKDGYLDYDAALNDRLGKGITPEKNANVLIWKAIGPRPEGGDRMPAEFFKRLGMEEPPEKGDYFIALDAYLKDHLKLDPAEFDAIFDQQDRARQRPWTAKDYPHIATWLKVNEKPLALVLEASKRPDYFNPLIIRRREDGLGALLFVPQPSVNRCRNLADALACRAMLRVGDGKFDDAWRDLLACHRLGRLVARVGTIIHAQIGVTINRIASDADLAYLECAGLTAKQVRDRLKDLDSLPAMAPLADKVDLGERFTGLDALQLVRRGGVEVLWSFGGRPTDKPIEMKPLDSVDFEPALRNVNGWYDRTAAAMRLKDRAEREKELNKINRDIKILAAELVGRMDRFKLAFGKDPPEKAVGRLFGDMLIRYLLPTFHNDQTKYDRAEQVDRNLRIAFALAAYRSDNGRYPAKLDDLASKYLAAVPDDLFSGKPLIYRLSEKGYLFYSLGPNGKDEGGRSERLTEEDDSVGDDIPVRMPLPELKPKK